MKFLEIHQSSSELNQLMNFVLGCSLHYLHQLADIMPTYIPTKVAYKPMAKTQMQNQDDLQENLVTAQQSTGKRQDAASCSHSVPPKPRISVEDVSGEIEFWSTAVYCFIIGARPPWMVVNGFIKQVWSGFAIDKISFMTNGIFIVRFKTKEHQQKALDYGSLMFDSKPVIVNEWRPEACLVKHDVQVIPIWVKLQGLDIKFWGMNSLKKIGGSIGKDQDFPKDIVFVDETGKDQCVQVDYEWLPISCHKCKGIGHSQDQCKIDSKKEVPKKVWKPMGPRPVKPVDPKLGTRQPTGPKLGVRQTGVPKQVVVQHQAVGHKDKTPMSLPLVSPVLTHVVPPVRKVNFPTSARIFSRLARDDPPEASSSGIKGPGFTFMDALNSAIQISKRKLDEMGGLNSLTKQKDLKWFLHQNNVGLFGLLETRVRCSNWNKVHNKVCSDWAICTNNSSHKGGRIWLIWKPSLFTINVLEVTAQTIFAEVMDNGKGTKFRLTVVYGFNKLAERIGTEISWAEIKHFQDTCHSCGLVNVKTIGNFFTWNNKHEAGSRVFSRIDRVLGNDDWGIEFPDCVAKFFPEGLYDHSPCIITLREQHDRRPRPFKYFNMWALADDFLDVISHTWEVVVPGTPMFCLANKLKFLKKPLKGLNKEGFHNIEHTYSLAHKALLLMQEEMQSTPLNSELCDNERVIAKEVARLLKAKHQFLSQKANMQWIEDGDDNTAFFHASIKRRRVVNKVFQISDNTGVLHEEPDGINKAFELYYMELLGSAKETQHVDRSVVQSGRMVQPAHSAILMKPVTPEEIKASMFSIPGTKAAGPDDYSSQFFKDSSEVTGGTVIQAVMDFF
ncbi:uncharacterized protein LOC141617081 [Silene latifolia]|uniref:uncharacterized protein LOC141617081 n=1 Tax=Silene latifolia TaxID=37657 RepID=UPI003D781D2C